MSTVAHATSDAHRIALPNQSGFTLVELVVALVIIVMAATTIVAVMSSVDSNSAESMQRVQAGNIANAYMREILSRPFTDPAMPDFEGARAAFDDVDDYNALNEIGAHDRYGNAITGLGNYQVSVNVGNVGLGGVGAAQSLLVTITVTSPSQYVAVLTGFKMLHP